MDQPTLDWSTAQVRDGKLTVALAGEPPEGWQDAFTTTARLLAGNRWDEVDLQEREATVGGVQPGQEEKLRHFLESVVQEANARTADPQDAQRGDDEQAGDADGDEQREQREPGGGDDAMTARFQAFAGDKER